MKKSRRKNTNEHDSMHLVEFSQGRPNEISLNVLDKKSSSSAIPEKKGLFSRFGARKKKGSYEGFGASIAIGSGENAPLKDALAKESSSSGTKASNVSGETQGKDGSSARKTRGKHATPQGKSSGKQGENVPFLPNASGFNSQEHEEIGRRRRRRARSRFISVSLVVIVAAGLLFLAGSWVYQEYEKNKSNRQLVETACFYIEQSDQTLVRIDEFFARPFDEDTIEQAEELKSQIPSALSLLQEAKQYAERADQAIENTNRDKEAAQCASNTIVSRETMFEIAEQKLLLDIDAKKSIDGMATIETNIDDAQYLMAQAAVTIEQTSPETVAQSTEWLIQAKEKLEQSKSILNEIIARFPDGDFTCYLDYLSKRLEEIDNGLRSNDAILVQDRKTAESYNDKYNQADREAAELANRFPEPFAAPLVSAYEQRAKSLDEQFAKLRNDIGSNDSVLRDYLGNDTQE